MLELIMPYSLSQIPYITCDALDAYAEDVLRDAMPEVLIAPCPIDGERFLEFYLGLDVLYKRLSINRNILGLTSFNAGYIKVFDEISNVEESIFVREGTVIIDTALTKKQNIGRRNFTYFHEASHWMVHRKIFSSDSPFENAEKNENRFLAAKEGGIYYSRSQKETNDNKRLERQADFLSSAFLMPRTTLRMAFRDFFTLYDEKPSKIVRGANTRNNCFAVMLPEYIAKTYNVSKHAALIRLEKLGAIVNS